MPLTNQPGTAVAQTGPAPLPRVSQPLAILIADCGLGRPINAPMKSLRDEAVAALPRFEAACQPAGEQAIMAWLLPFSVGCTVALTPAQFRPRAEVIAMACAHLPQSVLTPATQREGLAEFAYFPGAKEVLDLLTPKCRDWIRDRDALRRIVSITAPPAPAKLTDEERHAITARFRQQMAAVNTEAQELADQAADRAAALPVGRVATVPIETLAALRAANPRMQQALHDQRAVQALAAATARPGMPPKPPVHRPPGKRPTMPWHDQAGDAA